LKPARNLIAAQGPKAPFGGTGVPDFLIMPLDALRHGGDASAPRFSVDHQVVTWNRDFYELGRLPSWAFIQSGTKHKGLFNSGVLSRGIGKHPQRDCPLHKDSGLLYPSSIWSPAFTSPPSITIANIPLSGIMHSPILLYMAHRVWHSFPICVISRTTPDPIVR
jgi:hypothetical protein